MESVSAPDSPTGAIVEIPCPFCAQRVSIYLEPEIEGQMVQDCEVCCRPWDLRVRRGAGIVVVEVAPC